MALPEGEGDTLREPVSEADTEALREALADLLSALELGEPEALLLALLERVPLTEGDSVGEPEEEREPLTEEEGDLLPLVLPDTVRDTEPEPEPEAQADWRVLPEELPEPVPTDMVEVLDRDLVEV